MSLLPPYRIHDTKAILLVLKQEEFMQFIILKKVYSHKQLMWERVERGGGHSNDTF